MPLGGRHPGWEDTTMCAHGNCPTAEAPNCWTAHVVSDHQEQGWSKLCNGVIVFDDGFFLAPDGHSEPISPLAA